MLRYRARNKREKAMSKAKEKEYINWVDLRDYPRTLHFPFPVDTVGECRLSHDSYCGVHRGGMEFAVRLSGGEGQSIDVVEKERFVTPYPNAAFLREGKLHSTEYRNYRRSFFIIYSPRLEKAMLECGLRLDCPPWVIQMTPELPERMTQILQLLPRAEEPGVVDEIDALCWAFVVRVCRDQPKAITPAEHGGPHAISQDILDLSRELNRRCCEAVDFTGLARQFGLTRRTLFRHWARAFGQTPSQTLREMRLVRAMGMLERTSFPVNYICHAVGYRDPGHFARLFKERTGMMPLDYRKAKR